LKATTKQALWLLVYFALLLLPPALVLLAPRPAARELWRELSVGLAFIGLALMGLQFIPTARLRPLTNLFPVDDTYFVHKQTSMLAFLLIAAHPLILFLFNPNTVLLLNPLTAPTRAVLGVVAAIAVAGLIATSFFRIDLGLKYEPWRGVHTVLAPAAVILALLHMLGVDYYMSLPWVRGVWIALTVLWLGLLVRTRLIKPLRLLRRPYRVTSVEAETRSAWTLTLEPDGHPGIEFMPGQFVWLTIGRSPFSLREHPFSITSSAERTDTLQFGIGEAGDFTSQIGQVPVGTTAYVDGPHGDFTIDHHRGPGYVFIAGGIGSPPIISMLRTMADRGDGTPVWLFYGNRSWEDVYCRYELEALEQRLNMHLVHVLEAPPTDGQAWEGEVGFVTAEVLDRHLPPDRNGLLYFICGPLPMIRPVTAALKTVGIPGKQVITEEYEMV
jgi:predicted ferric reductase